MNSIPEKIRKSNGNCRKGKHKIKYTLDGLDSRLGMT